MPDTRRDGTRNRADVTAADSISFLRIAFTILGDPISGLCVK